MAQQKEIDICFTLDGSLDMSGRPSRRSRSGGWSAGFPLLVNQGLATLAFFGVSVNLVLFFTRVLKINTGDAANDVSKWTGTVYLFSLLGAFLSDSYWGRYKTRAIFQTIFVMGLAILSWSMHTFLLKPAGCGDERVSVVCEAHTKLEVGIFYFSIYLVALGNGGYQPNIATFGSDQFDEENPEESYSKVAFFSYFYLSLNLGQLVSNTFISYLQNEGFWMLGFWLSSGSALLALIIYLAGTPRYRYFPSLGNPLSRVGQVVVAASRKSMLKLQPGGEGLYERDNGVFSRRVLHTDGFRFFDRAAAPALNSDDEEIDNPWRLCTVTQVEEVKCVLRLLLLWLCTILYSVIFTQMASLFVVQGAAMKLSVSNFSIPPSSMSVFDVLSVACFILLNKRLLNPLVRRLRKDGSGMTELQRMGVGLAISIAATLTAGTVEHF